MTREQMSGDNLQENENPSLRKVLDSLGESPATAGATMHQVPSFAFS